MTQDIRHGHRRPPPDEPLRALRRKMRALSATTDLLHEIMGFGHFEEMAMTRDGLLIGRPRRSDGFDAFIGSVTKAMRERTFRLWNELTHQEQRLVLQRLREQNIDPTRIGIPIATASIPEPNHLTTTSSAMHSG